MKFIYRQNYIVKVIFISMIALSISIIFCIYKYEIIPMPQKDVMSYHFNILTINSIFSGFALTNLGILLSISDDQLIKKLEGTDILVKRNIVIGHSIIFGALSILIAVFFVFGININFLLKFIGMNIGEFLFRFFFNLEICSLIVSITYFLLSIRKMIQLLSLIYIPKKKYSDEQVERMKKQLNREETDEQK